MRLPRLLMDPIIRRKSRLAQARMDRFDIRLARTQQEYEDAFRLVHVAYVYQGIERLTDPELRITEQHVLPEASVLVAYEGDRLVGTISVTLDSPAGLALDKDYPEQLSALRRGGARLAEIGSLAVVERAWNTGVSQLLSLAAIRFGYRVLDVTHHVIGIHPKASPFYRAMWGFEDMGDARHHAKLEAPVIGLIQERAHAEAHMHRRLKGTMSSGVRPVEYVFGREVPEGLTMPENVPVSEWPRWKMSRDVFRALFVQEDRLGDLSTGTFRHLRRHRSDLTLSMPRSKRKADFG